MTGRPVAVHAMRGISAHSNGFQTCRALHLLQLLLGSVETPGGFRFKPPYPKPVAAHPKPHHKVTPGYPLDGPHARLSRAAPRTSPSTPTAARSASTRPSPGRRRSPRTA